MVPTGYVRSWISEGGLPFFAEYDYGFVRWELYDFLNRRIPDRPFRVGDLTANPPSLAWAPASRHFAKMVRREGRSFSLWRPIV